MDVTMTNMFSCLERKQQLLIMNNTKPEDLSFCKSLQATRRFPWKLYQIVKACKTGAITWDESGRTLLVRPEQFKRECLDPEDSAFKTKNMGSFVRQLNLYGFHKLQSSRAAPDEQQTCEPVIYRFQNDFFVRGRPDLLHKLHRNVGIRSARHGCKCNGKENAQETRPNKSSARLQLPMILPSIGRSWSLSSELNSSAKVKSYFKVDCSPPHNFSDCRTPLEEIEVKVEPQTMMMHGSFNRRDLQISSLGNGSETKDVTLVKKEDFDEIVSVFVEMLNQDPDVREISLAQMDCSISYAVNDLMRRRAQIIEDYEMTMKTSFSTNTTTQQSTENLCLPVHDSSFSFSANASRPIFKVADSHMKHDDINSMSMFEQTIHSQCACMDFDHYKENLAYI